MKIFHKIFIIVVLSIISVSAQKPGSYYKGQPKKVYVEYEKPDDSFETTDYRDQSKQVYETKGPEYKKVKYVYEKKPSEAPDSKTVYEYREPEYEQERVKYAKEYRKATPEYKKYEEEYRKPDEEKVVVNEKNDYSYKPQSKTIYEYKKPEYTKDEEYRQTESKYRSYEDEESIKYEKEYREAEPEYRKYEDKESEEKKVLVKVIKNDERNVYEPEYKEASPDKHNYESEYSEPETDYKNVQQINYKKPEEKRIYVVKKEESYIPKPEYTTKKYEEPQKDVVVKIWAKKYN